MTQMVTDPELREMWKARRDNMQHVDWINGRYQGDEKFECICGSHVAVRLSNKYLQQDKCIGCGTIYSFLKSAIGTPIYE